MKRATRQEFPPGWNEKKVLAVNSYYDRQTEEEEAAAEIDTAPEAAAETWMSVPAELVGIVTRLIENHANNQKNKPRTRKARK